MKHKRLLFIIILLVLVSVVFAEVKFRVDRVECTGCGDCEIICPVHAIKIVDGKSSIDPEICMGCGLCQVVCTYDAIR